MKSLFNAITVSSLRFRAIVIAFAIVASTLGIQAWTQLKQELIPSVSFPQTIILAQVSGMDSEQVLKVLTERLEIALDEQVPTIVNIQSTTTGSIGTFISASYDFGLDQNRLQQDIQNALDSVWLPSRSIQPQEGSDRDTFITSLISEITPDILIYISEQNPNFLFQLSPEFWSLLPDDTVKTTLAYLSQQQSTAEEGKSALESLVEQEIAPQITGLETVASLDTNGGQVLPSDTNAVGLETRNEDGTSRNLLLQLSPDVWQVVTVKAGNLGDQNDEAASKLADVKFTIPTEVPTLPPSWQFPYFKDTSDLLELSGLVTPISTILNNFVETGKIVGPLGQTNDLTPEVVQQMLEIDPSMVEFFEAEHLVAMPAEVFAVLPSDFVDNLDGFTRDALAAASLASSITGEIAEKEPVDLPTAWRIQPPRIIPLNLSELIPTITFSISATELPTAITTETNNANESTDGEITTVIENTNQTEIPEGPAIPPIFGVLGTQFGIEFNTADDLINIELPPEMAEQFGEGSLSAANLFNFVLLLADPSSLPTGTQLPSVSINPSLLLGGFSQEAIEFIAANDPTFIRDLQPDVYTYFSEDVLKSEVVSPPLGTAWDTLSNEPQFQQTSLTTAADLLKLGDGKASTILNNINESIPERFAGYEVRLFDGLTPITIRYFAIHEADFYSNLNEDVLLKFSPAVLSAIPEVITSALSEETQTQISAIVTGKQPPAAAQLAERYTTNVPAADPSAPALNSEWQFIAGFLNIELNNAYDLFRFPDATGTPSQFINGLFNSPGGANFAPGLLGGMSKEAFDYIAGKDSNFIDELSPQALLLLPKDVFGTLPQNIQDKATAGEVFIPTSTVTRVNGAPGLFISVFKTSDANTVETFYQIESVLHDIESKNPNIHFDIVFEQASFIEKSIEGVVREGGLGAVFAIVVILVFLSSGVWGGSARRTTGIALTVLFTGLLIAATFSQSANTNGDFGLAFAQVDVVIKVLLALGAFAGLLILLWPGQLPYPAWRSTLVIGVSIPLSIFMAIAGMKWLSPALHNIIAPLAQNEGFIGGLFTFVLRLFPDNLTINIMTLSGLTVAIGRVVDDSIVVLENIFKQLQTGMDKREAILSGTRDVSLAIFAATFITMIVFIPLGMTGGIIGEIFLPFGLAVAYSLAASFIVAITVVPLLAYTIINAQENEEHTETSTQRAYAPILKWALSSNSSKLSVVAIAVISLVAGGGLFGSRPATFLPAFGEPQVTVSVNLPQGTSIIETNAKVIEIEQLIKDTIPAEELGSISSIVGGGGVSFESLIGGGGGVTENIASLTIVVKSPEALELYTPQLREKAIALLGEEQVTVSGGSITDSGIGGFELVVSGPNQAVLEEADPIITEALSNIEGLTNVTSNMADGTSEGSSATYIRVNAKPAVNYSAELETEDTLGVTNKAIETLAKLPNLPEGITVGRGFNSEFQAQGFNGVILAMGISIVMIVIILIITFNSAVYWFALIFSVAVAPVGAAIGLTLADRPLGISALIGLLMLIGLVVTNAIVLIDRVQANYYERHMNLYDSLIEAGNRRLRPILMTALATIFALIPLAIGLSEGAIIAAELGIVVIGGLFSSTLLTLLVVPALYSLLSPIHERFARILSGRSGDSKIEAK